MQCVFSWSIKIFSCHLAVQECGDVIFSPVFKADESSATEWIMSVYPRGQMDYEDYVSVHLVLLSTDERDFRYTKLKCKISIMDADSKVWAFKETEQSFGEPVHIQFNTLARRDKILEERLNVLPGDVLTFCCQICAYDEKDLELMSRKEVKMSHNELKNLSKDLKRLFDSGKFSDVTLTAKGGNISSHRSILSARSNVFEKHLRNCPSEEYINVPEFEKSTIEALLTFMYTGEIDVKFALSSMALYDAAERYAVRDLSSSLVPSKILALTETAAKRYTFTWRLNNFSCIKERRGRIVYSDKFNTKPSTAMWNLSLGFHRGRDDGDENIGIYLNKLWSAVKESSVYVHFNLHLVDKGQNYRYTMSMKECFKPTSRHGFPLFIKRSTLFQEMNELLPFDILTVRCELRVYDGTYRSTTKRSYYSANANLLQVSYAKNVSESLGELLSNDVASDIIVRSTGRSFFLHKPILCARSTVFADLLENVDDKLNPYTIDISDIKPSILELLFTFMYTGEMADLKVETALDHYTAAYSYNITDLNNICSDFLKSNVTTGNACEIMALAQAVRDEELKCLVKDFICSHADDVVTSRQWQDFVTEHSGLYSDILTSLSRESK